MRYILPILLIFGCSKSPEPIPVTYKDYQLKVVCYRGSIQINDTTYNFVRNNTTYTFDFKNSSGLKLKVNSLETSYFYCWVRTYVDGKLIDNKTFEERDRPYGKQFEYFIK